MLGPEDRGACRSGIRKGVGLGWRGDLRYHGLLIGSPRFTAGKTLDGLYLLVSFDVQYQI